MSKEVPKLYRALRENFVQVSEDSFVLPGYEKVKAQTLSDIGAIERRIETFMNRGFSLVCASCVRLWEGVDLGLPDCGQLGCPGPKRMGEFPMYDGPVSPHSWHKWCLVCGNEAVGGFRVAGGTRLFGLCKLHKNEFLGGGSHEV